jgi:hypothetical protein
MIREDRCPLGIRKQSPLIVQRNRTLTRFHVRHRYWLFLMALVSYGCNSNVDVVEVTDRNPPPPVNDGLVDDLLEDKETVFDPERVDRRPLDGWRINQSAAVIRLDVPLAQPDLQPGLLYLFPSYRAAMQYAESQQSLVSVNMIDNKAKQFDDGLYAAIDLAYFQGHADRLPSHTQLVKRLLEAVGDNSPATPFLAAGLTRGGQETPAQDRAARDKWIAMFQANPALAKPIGFYTWSEPLRRCWAFMRFFQQSLEPRNPGQRAVINALTVALNANEKLKADYQSATQFYGRLTNPLGQLSLIDMIGVDLSSDAIVEQLRISKGMNDTGVVFFPPSTSRETELFYRLFPEDLPESANLMQELIRAIRSGEVDLTPRPDSGWYDHQVYALQTLLLPERGEECNKLLLTKPYKKRMLEAFAALVTKRRETHVRQLLEKKSVKNKPAPKELKTVSPRLRLEPCPSYYVRTARSYAFLSNFLVASLGDETLRELHGLRATGLRSENLANELAVQRDLFYGFYLLSCEDIGHKPALHDGEVADRDACYSAAEKWIEKFHEDPDLAEDTRVAVPIHSDPMKGTTRLWVTLGVRLTKLDALFVRAPSIKPTEGDGDWTEVEMSKLKASLHLIAVDEFAEVEIPTLSPPDREEFRQICDKYRTKEKILEALATRR